MAGSIGSGPSIDTEILKNIGCCHGEDVYLNNIGWALDIYDRLARLDGRKRYRIVGEVVSQDLDGKLKLRSRNTFTPLELKSYIARRLHPEQSISFQEATPEELEKESKRRRVPRYMMQNPEQYYIYGYPIFSESFGY